MSQQSVLTAIFEKLNPAISSGTVFKTAFGGSDSVRGRIFQTQASQDTVLPLCLFEISNEITSAFLASPTKSVHEIAMTIVMYFRIADGVAVALASENILFDLLHVAEIPTTDADIYSIDSTCVSRGVPTILSDAVSIRSEYRVLVSKQA